MDTDVQEGVQYNYYVRGVGVDGVYSQVSNSVGAYLFIVLVQPSIFAPTTPDVANFQSDTELSDISGFATPSSDVYLVHDGNLLSGSVLASSSASISEFDYRDDGEFLWLILSSDERCQKACCRGAVTTLPTDHSLIGLNPAVGSGA